MVSFGETFHIGDAKIGAKVKLGQMKIVIIHAQAI